MRSSGKSASASLSPGTIVGHYVLQQQIGAGSGGVVYRAFDHRLQRAIALKILDPSLLGEETTWALAVSEARAAGSLAHPNICAVFDVVEEDGRVCLAMELVEGRSLHSAIPGHGLPYDATVRYGAQIASALAHAHDKGVCHGDVSARNVMLTLDDRVKVLDFGLARLLSRSNSPAEPSEGARRDLQQLGILLCQMATGVFPAQALDVLVGTAAPSAILQSSPVAALPKRLGSIVARCLESDPTRSYQRAQQTAADLEDELRLACMSPAPPARTPAKRNVAIGAALLLAALLVFIPLWVRDSHTMGTTHTTARPLQQATAKKLPELAPGATAGAVVHHTSKPVRKAPEKKQVAQVPEATGPPLAHHTAGRIQEAAAKKPPEQKAGIAGIPDVKVWVNTESKVYHCSTSRLYGKTDQGKYMTQAQARAAGYRPAFGKPCR